MNLITHYSWTDSQVVTSLVLLNLAGGTCVEDLKILNADEGFCRRLSKAELHGLKSNERRELERRWWKEKKRFVPSPSATFRYLAEFHDPDQEKARKASERKAFIPIPNDHLKGLAQVNKNLCIALNSAHPHRTATLDLDATLVETTKKNALYCYKKFKAYQPLNTWWDEQGILLHTEFRDGNVPAGYEQLRVFKEALKFLPPEVEIVKIRPDTAGYQHELLKYCDTGANKRFGRIEFAIGCDVTRSFKDAVAENAAWWGIMIIALNLNLMMKILALEPSMANKRMKAIRFSIINLSGRVFERSRTHYLRLSKGHPSLHVPVDARKRIAMLQAGPSG